MKAGGCGEGSRPLADGPRSTVMNTFLIRASFPIAVRGLFVFAGDVLSGVAKAGMRFEVPEAGHRWLLTAESVEMVNTVHGAKVALVVNAARDIYGFLPGLGVGYTTELTDPVEHEPRR